MQRIDFSKQNKIWIIGCPGSGKTHLSKLISLNSNIQHIELDHLFWLPNWQRETDYVFKNKITAIANKNSWIIDGVYTQVEHIIRVRVNILIWLDFSLPILLYRTIKRAIINLICKIKFCNNNKESLFRLFNKDSIVLFTIKSYRENKVTYKKIVDTISQQGNSTRIIHIKNFSDYKKFYKIIGVYNEKP